MAGRIVLVVGTRPECIKVGPIAHELRQLGIEPEIIATGQHSTLLAGTPAESDLKDAYSLGMRSDGDVEGWVMDAITRISDRLPGRDAIVVVQGDTMSAYAAALAASNNGLTLAHVEAGIRSGDFSEPSPEERFRTEIGMHADLHFAPTEHAAANLRTERVQGRIFVTGNTVVSALQRYASLLPERPVNQVLVTMHRREFLGLGRAHVEGTVKAVLSVARARPGTRFVWPMHPALRNLLGYRPPFTPRNVRFIMPLPYASMIDTLKRSKGVLTDSGGLAEEAATLGVPCSVMRNKTDRPESVAAGLAKLFPPTPDGMIAGIRWILDEQHTRTPNYCFGGPESARNVAEILLKTPA